MQLTPGDVVRVDLGMPRGHEAGFRHPAIVVTSQEFIRGRVIQVVPLTSTDRGFIVEVRVDGDEQSGLAVNSVAQPQHVRSISVSRIEERMGNIGPVTLALVRESLDALFDLPE